MDQLIAPRKLFWTHPGANYVVCVDHVAAAFGDDVEGGIYLVFITDGGSSVRNKYENREARDAALAAFKHFVEIA